MSVFVFFIFRLLQFRAVTLYCLNIQLHIFGTARHNKRIYMNAVVIIGQPIISIPFISAVRIATSMSALDPPASSLQIVKYSRLFRHKLRTDSTHSSSSLSRSSVSYHPGTISLHNSRNLRKSHRHRNALFMVALCNRADHIYFHPVVCSSSFFLLLFFLA